MKDLIGPSGTQKEIISSQNEGLINRRWSEADSLVEEVKTLKKLDIQSAAIASGSYRYKGRRELISDLDIEFVVREQDLGDFLQAVRRVVDIEDPLLNKKEAFLRRGEVDLLVAYVHTDDLRYELKFWTTESLSRIISLNPPDRRSIKHYQEGRSPFLTLKSLGGETYSQEVQLDRLPEDPGIVKVTVPSPRKLLNGFPIIPFDHDQLLTGQILYDTHQDNQVRAQYYNGWRRVIRGILHYNDLYEPDGTLKTEANDIKYLRRVLYRGDSFNRHYIQKLHETYEDHLYHIEAMARSKNNV